jgi:hypothetical protein
VELQLLSYNTDLPKPKKIVKVSRITPFYGTLLSVVSEKNMMASMDFCIVVFEGAA